MQPQPLWKGCPLTAVYAQSVSLKAHLGHTAPVQWQWHTLNRVDHHCLRLRYASRPAVQTRAQPNPTKEPQTLSVKVFNAAAVKTTPPNHKRCKDMHTEWVQFALAPAGPSVPHTSCVVMYNRRQNTQTSARNLYCNCSLCVASTCVMHQSASPVWTAHTHMHHQDSNHLPMHI
jgi:hypothetical protein